MYIPGVVVNVVSGGVVVEVTIKQNFMLQCMHLFTLVFQYE